LNRLKEADIPRISSIRLSLSTEHRLVTETQTDADSFIFIYHNYAALLVKVGLGGSVAEWLACWTQAQKGLGSNCSRDAVG